MERKNNYSKERLSERIANTLNQILRKDVRDPRLQFSSITRVELSPDNMYATLFWDCFQPEKKEQIQMAYNKAKGLLRAKLGEVLQRRCVPEIQFIYDSKLDDEARITQLLSGDPLLNSPGQ